MKEARCSIDGIMEKRNIGSVPNKGPHFVWGSTVNLGVHILFGGPQLIWGSTVNLGVQGGGPRFIYQAKVHPNLVVDSLFQLGLIACVKMS